jgi:hypothetical protein
MKLIECRKANRVFYTRQASGSAEGFLDVSYCKIGTILVHCDPMGSGCKARVSVPGYFGAKNSILFGRQIMAATEETHLQEHRVFEPPAALAKDAAISGMAAYRALCAEAEQRLRGLLGAAGAREPLLEQAVHAHARRERARRSTNGSTTASSTSRTTAWTAPRERQRRQDRDHLRSRRRHRHARELPRTARQRVCKFANGLKAARRQEGRPRGHLHVDVDRGRSRDAGLRAHRRDALGGVRRLLGQVAAGAHHRRRRGRGDHRRRAVPRR